jgi:hypothetical protein
VTSSISAAPVPRSLGLSALFNTQSKPILSPYFYAGVDHRMKLDDAFANPGIKTVTVAFAVALKNQVGFELTHLQK